MAYAAPSRSKSKRQLVAERSIPVRSKDSIPGYAKDMAAKVEAAILDGSFWKLATDDRSHMEDEHVALPRHRYLDDVLSGRKARSGGFPTKAGAKMAVEEVLLAPNLVGMASPVDCICTWSGRNPGKDGMFVFPFSKEAYGDVRSDPPSFPAVNTALRRNRSGHIAEYETNCICVVLHANESSPLGFTVKTAYPDIDLDVRTPYPGKEIRPTGADLADDLKRTRVYQASSDEAKAAFEEKVAAPRKMPSEPSDGDSPQTGIETPA